jgi:hypothetical protein
MVGGRRVNDMERVYSLSPQDLAKSGLKNTGFTVERLKNSELILYIFEYIHLSSSFTRFGKLSFNESKEVCNLTIEFGTIFEEEFFEFGDTCINNSVNLYW